MSFSFKWPRFSDQFHETAIQLLNNALNKGNKPPVIADKIEVVELEMGTQPPELEIRDIGDLTMTQFRGIFRMSYAGDAHIVLRTKVQANPLFHKKTGLHQMGGSKGMLAANQPLVVPMLLRLSNFRLNSVVVLVVSKPKGITLVFKTDPLQNVDIHSTFDSIAVIQSFIQKEIEGQLRQMFREDLPGIIHKLSQQWVKKSTTVETPYLIHHRSLYSPDIDTVSNPELLRSQSYQESGRVNATKSDLHTPSQRSGRHDRRFSLSPSTSGRPSLSDLRSDSANPLYSSESEHDAFSRLAQFRAARGLGDLTEELDDEFGSGYLDIVDADNAMSSIHPSVFEARSVVEYESIPAVGGGVVTRPRIIHSASLHQPPSTPSQIPSTSRLTAPALQQLTRRLGDETASRRSAKRESWDSTVLDDGLLNSRNAALSADTLLVSQRRAYVGTTATPPDRNFRPSIHLTETIPDDMSLHSPTQRRTSRRNSLTSQPTYDLSFDPDFDPSDPNITLRPGSHGAVSRLSLLNRSNNTLSPFTGNLEHIATRSMPLSMLSPTNGSSTEKQPVKARRKRTYRLGGAMNSVVQDTTTHPESHMGRELLSPSVVSDFDQSDIDRYFRSQDHSDALSPLSMDGLNQFALRRRPSRRTLQDQG